MNTSKFGLRDNQIPSKSKKGNTWGNFMNKNILICFILLIVTGIFSGCISRPDSISGNDIGMNDYDEKTLQVDLDKQTIAQLSLEWGISGKNTSTYYSTEEKNHIIVSTMNINKNYNFTLEDISVTILTPEEIQQKSNKYGDFLYLEFREFEIRGNNATVRLDNSWAVSEETRKSGLVFLSGGGAKIPFKKEGGEWMRENVTEIWTA